MQNIGYTKSQLMKMPVYQVHKLNIYYVTASVELTIWFAGHFFWAGNEVASWLSR